MVNKKKRYVSQEEFKDEVWNTFIDKKINEIGTVFLWILIIAAVVFLLAPIIGYSLSYYPSVFNAVFLNAETEVNGVMEPLFNHSSLIYWDACSVGMIAIMEIVFIIVVILLSIAGIMNWLRSNYEDAWEETARRLK